MIKFREFVKMLNEAPLPGGPPGGLSAPAGLPPGGPPPGLGSKPPMPMGGPPLPPMGGGMGGPPGLGGPPMGGPGGAPPGGNQVMKLKSPDVWSVLEKVLGGGSDQQDGGKK